MTAPRTVTLPTLDAGNVTLTCPAWCAGHTDHRPDTHRVDLDHKGPETRLTYNGVVLWTAFIGQAPFATDPAQRGPGLYVEQGHLARTFRPVDVYDLASAIETHADQLTEILAGESE